MKNLKYDLFISYAREDLDEVSSLIRDLQSAIPGLTYWFDITGIESASDFEEKIITAISESKYVIFALSDYSMNSEWAKDEVTYAKNIGKKVIPVLLKGSALKEGWFLFKFGRIDCIDSTSSVQMEKLTSDLLRWLNLEGSGIDQKELIKDQSVEDPLPKHISKTNKLFRNILIFVMMAILVLASFIGYKFMFPPQQIIAETGYADGILRINGVEYPMVYVNEGTYEMGSQDAEAYDIEKPIVTIQVHSFHIGKYEVTQELWNAVMDYNPSSFKGARLPVDGVSWDDCQIFINKINDLTGVCFSLPTEVEWEYAAAGGDKSLGYKYSGSNDLGQVAWYAKNAPNSTCDVGLKCGNELGIHDMSGNVYEWCNNSMISYDSLFPISSSVEFEKVLDADYRVRRGGSWRGSARGCRVSYRFQDVRTTRDNAIGLRLCLR